MRSIVVTGGGRGVGRAVVERLVEGGDAVVVLELEDAGLEWTAAHPDAVRVVLGDAGRDSVAAEAADSAEAMAPLAGWVNNAAVFRDAWLHDAGGEATGDLVLANLRPVLAGSAAAIRLFRAHRRPGSIVNVSSHQAQRAVPGALPYAVAKAAIEGATRALAVDYGGDGIRVNAVALGSIVTERMRGFLDAADDATRAAALATFAAVHPLGRAGETHEVATAVEFLLSDAAAFVTGAVLPVDGGRAALGVDPEARRPE